MTIVALSFATGAYAQSLEDIEYLAAQSRRPVVRMDPLDPVSRVALLAAAAGRGTFTTPTTTPENIAYFPTAQDPAPLPQPSRIIVEQRSQEPSRFYSTLNKISAGLDVSHQALDVYEHVIEANALKGLLNQR
jgi:hypothetical protein